MENLKKYDNFKITPPYYSGYTLMSKTCKDGTKPEWYISTSNRNGGKTTFYNGWALHNFIQKSKKFYVCYRNKYEMDAAADSFFNDIKKYFFKNLIMKQETGVRNVFVNLYVAVDSDAPEWHHCGYAFAIAGYDQIKKRSHLLNDGAYIIMDEFQLEDSSKYLKNKKTGMTEIDMLLSIHASLARGNGKQVRYLPVILIGNLIDKYNPYYEMLGISKKINENLQYMRGNGWVLEQDYNESAAELNKKSAFNRAAKNSSYAGGLSSKKKYLLENNDFIVKISENGQYIGTIVHKNKSYGVRYIYSIDSYYISDKADPSYKTCHACTTDDIAENVIFTKKHKLRSLLEKKLYDGILFFSSMEAKKAGYAFIKKVGD